MSSSNTAPIKWAQRSDSLYLTIAVPDVKDETITLTDEALQFRGTSNGKEYVVDIEFFKPVNSSQADSRYAVHPRNVQFFIIKKDTEEEFWPRLLKDKAKEKNQVQIDWDRYVDEDEEDGGFDTAALDGGHGMGGMGGMGMGGMGMGGMGGMGGMDMEALMKQMGGMGAMGGMGDMGNLNFDDMGGDEDENDDDDDDDEVEDLPELEEVN